MVEKNKSIHAGHRERLRNRLRGEGLTSFSEHEVLELLLTYAIPRQDVNPLAHELIDHFGSLSAVLEADTRELMKVKGVGENTACVRSAICQNMQYLGLEIDEEKNEEKNRKVSEYGFGCIMYLRYEADQI